ncbi:DUF6705 family protein [uncultured Kordia sp.]|uniref:DUF6705 family protein n=1 Tax=uncultured Kordia sp. TaxID=507699 RepID=UPI002604ED42|nr:DUF6705 family protein [uncultured Kordia sp.]
MKHTIYILFTLLCSYQLTAQTVIDIAGERESKYYKNGDFYMKDIQNLFQPYLGTWKYIDGNKEFRITLTKITMYHEIDADSNTDYYTDGISVRYQKYENGLMIYQSPIDSYPDGSIKEFGKLRLGLVDYQRIYKNTVLNVSRNAVHAAHLNLIPNNAGNYNLHLKLYTEKTGLGLEYEPVTTGNPYHSTPSDIIMTKM